jgi:hypothetical protein
MKRVLMVYHDTNVADIEADELRRAGYEVDRCAGPIGGAPCPVMRGEPCWQVEQADVLVYDTWEAAQGHHDLVADLRTVHPDTPLVLTSSGPIAERVPPPETGGDASTVFHAPSRATLRTAIELALREAKSGARTAVSRATEGEAAHAYHGPRW